jgi:hypothetical protein
MTDADFAAQCERDSLSGRALDPAEMERLYRLAGHTGGLPPYRMAYPPLWEMIAAAKRRCAR